MHNLTSQALTVRVLNSTAAGSTAVNTTAVDTLGYMSVRFVALLGTLTATQVTSMKVQGSDDNSTFADMVDENGTVQTGNMPDADSNKALIVDVYKPKHRYVRATINRGTANAVIDGVVAELYLASDAPVTADATVSKQLVSNAAG